MADTPQLSHLRRDCLAARSRVSSLTRNQSAMVYNSRQGDIFHVQAGLGIFDKMGEFQNSS